MRESHGLFFRDEDQSRDAANRDILTSEAFASEFGGESFEPDPEEAGFCAPAPCPSPERTEGRIFRAARIPLHHNDAVLVFLEKLSNEFADGGVCHVRDTQSGRTRRP